jgi:hypothetical protein
MLGILHIGWLVSFAAVIMEVLQYTGKASRDMMSIAGKYGWPSGPFPEEARESLDDRVRSDS